MSQRNVDAFLRGAAAIARGDIDSIPELVDSDAVFEPLRSATEGAFVGHEGIRRFVADTQETFNVFEPDFTDVRDLGDRVLAIGTIRVRGRSSGAESEIPTAVVAEYRESLLVRYKDYGEARGALRAVGLDE